MGELARLRAIEEIERSAAALPAPPDHRLREALERIIAICDTDRDVLRETYGSEFRAYMVVIPSIANEALTFLAATPNPEPEATR